MHSNLIHFKEHKPRVHPDAFVDPSAVLLGQVDVEEGAAVFARVVIRGDDGPVVVGKGTVILDGVLISSHGGAGVTLGQSCLVEQGSVLRGCTLGSKNIVSTNVTILEGTKTGDGCKFEHLAFVPAKREYPTGAVISGSPGAIKRSLYQSETEAFEAEMARYREKAKTYRESAKAK